MGPKAAFLRGFSILADKRPKCAISRRDLATVASSNRQAPVEERRMPGMPRECRRAAAHGLTPLRARAAWPRPLCRVAVRGCTRFGFDLGPEQGESAPKLGERRATLGSAFWLRI